MVPGNCQVKIAHWQMHQTLGQPLSLGKFSTVATKSLTDIQFGPKSLPDIQLGRCSACAWPAGLTKSTEAQIK